MNTLVVDRRHPRRMGILVELTDGTKHYYKTHIKVKSVTFFNEYKAQFTINEQLEKVPAVRGQDRKG